jgi:hypothetical protein
LKPQVDRELQVEAAICDTSQPARRSGSDEYTSLGHDVSRLQVTITTWQGLNPMAIIMAESVMTAVE